MYDRLGEVKRQHQNMEKKDFHAKTLSNNDIDWLIYRAEEARRYDNVISEMKETHNSMCKNLNQKDWTAGFGAGIDFIEENLYRAAKRDTE